MQWCSSSLRLRRSPLLLLLLLASAARVHAGPLLSAPYSSGGGATAASERCAALLRSTRIAPGCDAPDKETPRWPLLITGAGRSGTLFTAMLLNRLGMEVAHDNRFDPRTGEERSAAGPMKLGAVSWPYAFYDDSYPKWAGNLHGGRFAKVFLQTRHPLPVISSRAASMFGGNTLAFVQKHINMPSPTGSYDNDLRVSMVHWLEWNTFVSKVADWQFRLEDMSAVEVCRRAQLLPMCPSDEQEARVRKSLQSSNVNHLQDRNALTWEVMYAIDPILTTAIKKLACTFGYDCDVAIKTTTAAATLGAYSPYSLAVCAVVPPFDVHIRDWLDFYLATGVARFYLYIPTNTRLDTLDILKSYDQQVRLLSLSSLADDETIASHCVRVNPDRVARILVLDTTDYIYPQLLTSLDEYFRTTPGCETAPVTTAQLFGFGPDNHETPQTTESYPHVIDAFRLRSAKPLQRHALIVLDAHRCSREPRTCWLDPVNPPPTGWSEAARSCGQKLRGNAYVTYTRLEFMQRQLRTLHRQRTSSAVAAAGPQLAADLAAAVNRGASLATALDHVINKADGLSESDKSQLLGRLRTLNYDLNRLNSVKDDDILKYVPMIVQRRNYGADAAYSAKRAAMAGADLEKLEAQEGVALEATEDDDGSDLARTGRVLQRANSIAGADDDEETKGQDDDAPFRPGHSGSRSQLARTNTHTTTTTSTSPLLLPHGARTYWRKPSPTLAASQINPPYPDRLARILSLTTPCPTLADASAGIDQIDINPHNRSDGNTSRNAIFRFLHIPKTGGSSVNVLLRAAAPLFGKHFLQLYTSRLAERHVPQVYTAGAVDVVSAEFDASQRFQFPPPANRVIYDFVWLREPANRVLSQFEHHLAQGRFDINQLEWEDMVKKLLNPDTCVDNEAEHCQSLSDPDKCLGGGFCGVIRNHQTHVLAGFRLYPRTVRETLLQDERALVCTAQRTVLDMAVVGITEYFNVSLCLLLHTMGWNNLFDECCGQGLSNGLQCNWLTDKLTINVRDARKESKVAATATHNYAAKYWERPEIVAALKSASMLDCQVYALGLRRFQAQVRRLEALSGISFLPEGGIRLQGRHCDA